MKNFVLIGAAGYIAPRHMDAIHHLGHNLDAAFDPRDTVGILDRSFPNCAFFTQFEKLTNYAKSRDIDYVSICSPNNFHLEHIEWALRMNCDVICEKPLVLTVQELDRLEKLEAQTGHRVYTVLQLRVHETIKGLKKKIASEPRKRHQVELSYMTSRGPWYFESWKGDDHKSGGLITNIGIHLFDMLIWIFGDVVEYKINEKSRSHESGTLQLANADVNWFLSIDRKQLPKATLDAGKSTYRNIQIDGAEFEFSEGFTELHKTVYQNILAGDGCGIQAARPAIALTEKLRGL